MLSVEGKLDVIRRAGTDGLLFVGDYLARQGAAL
jgi:hypothetical protein